MYNNVLATLLGSKLRAKLLILLFTHPDERYFVRKIAALIDEDSTNVSRELARLKKNGILVSITEGKQKYYQINDQYPLFEELRKLIIKIVNNPVRFNVSEKRLEEFCRKHHIRKLSLFGSVLREDFRPDSDIDVMVEFETGHVPGFNIVDIEKELSDIVGRKIDLRTPKDLSKYFREQVVREAEVRYAAK